MPLGEAPLDALAFEAGIDAPAKPATEATPANNPAAAKCWLALSPPIGPNAKDANPSAVWKIDFVKASVAMPVNVSFKTCFTDPPVMIAVANEALKACVCASANSPNICIDSP